MPRSAAVTALSLLLACVPALAADDGLSLFTTHVRTLLIENCVKCHGGDKTKGQFDLTTREGLLHPGAEGTNIIPGDSKRSRLYRLIAHLDDPHMPEKGAKLPDESIAKLAAWIDAGAPFDKPLVDKPRKTKPRATVTDEDRKFWSLRPLAHPTPPAVNDKSWPRNPIDPFILAKLEQNNLPLNPPAEKRKLIRRLTLDLTGLPPTPAEIDAFLSDASPTAYEALVDRLLASPRFGERYGRHWLDLARFGESHGYEQDYDRPNAYHYRDFVIRAFNSDMPFDQFVKWQIAGDELAPNDPLAMMATGFLAAGTHATQITANQAEKERYDELDDMAGTIGTAMLGMTIACARCHDHKFDPIPTADYYRLISAFTTTVRSDLDIDLDPEKYKREKSEFDTKHGKLVADLQRYEKDQLPTKLNEWLAKGEPVNIPPWLILDLPNPKSSGGATFTKQDDGSLLVTGKRATHDVYTLTADLTAGITIRAIRLEALSHPSLVKGGPGRADNGNFALSHFSLSANGKDLKLVNPKATFEQKGLPIAATIDEDGTSAWAVDPQFGKDHAAGWQLAEPVTLDKPTQLTFTLKFQNNTGHGIARPRLSISLQDPPPSIDEHRNVARASSPSPSAPQSILELPAILKSKDRTLEQQAKLLSWFRTTDPEWAGLNSLVQTSLKNHPKPHLVKVLVSSEGTPAVRLHTQGPDFYDKTYLLRRGDLNQKVSEVALGFPQLLVRNPAAEKRWIVQPPANSKLSYRRTSLANWLTDVDAGAGHLLARVIVNRLWQHHLGHGLVPTPNDFGAQGAPPTHPELLDYLATELIKSNWRLKPIHKLILTSATYQQSSSLPTDHGHRTTDDSLFNRFPVRRLEAEPIRDSMLFVSGQLDPTMFGPGTLDESMKRRSIYFTTKRSKLIPLMTLFDAPDSLQGLASRSSTTIAPQALALMNNPHVRSYAQAFATRLTPAAKKDLPAAIHQAYEESLGRPPTADELADVTIFIRELSANKDNPTPALTLFCQSLFALNEFVFAE